MSRRGAAATGTPSSPWMGGAWTWLRTPDRRLLVLSILLQVGLALLAYDNTHDMRIFQATGYLVGTGHSPYVPLDLRAVFHDRVFQGRLAIGYPPPWPLLLGGIYRLSYAIVPDLHLYAVAIKLPVIAANAGLAYLAGAALQNLGAASAVVRRAWLALLFNPFLLYVGSVWGQIDAVVALLSLAALLLVAAGRRDLSAVTLALAVCVKPTAAPMLLAVLLFVGAGSVLGALRYAAVFAAGAFVFYVAPFLALGWDASPARAANAQFSMIGAMSITAVARLWTDTLLLEGHWWLLGLLWAPALLVAALIARGRSRGPAGLLAVGVALTLVFFLFRTWLAEPNVVVVLAPVLVLAALGRLDRRLYTALWIVPLAFIAANASPVHLAWHLFPATVDEVMAAAARHADVTVAMRAALVVAWQIVGWWIVVLCLRPSPAAGVETGRRRRVGRYARRRRPHAGGAAVRAVFELGDGLALAVAEQAGAQGPPDPDAVGPFPTSGLQKGLLLLDGGQELSSEGVGFGVPVLKRGPRAVFPGAAELIVHPGTPHAITMAYTMDRVERLGGRRHRLFLHRPLDEAREAFALLYRRAPLLRRPLLAASNGVRWLLRVHTRFEQTTPVAVVPVTYAAGDVLGEVRVSADLTHLPDAVTEVVLMNELGADVFDRFVDSDGADLRGAGIGAWNQVRAATASFVAAESGISFTLASDPDPDAPHVRLYRGREVANGRLAWAGFGYSLRPGPPSFTYTLRVARDEVPS